MVIEHISALSSEDRRLRFGAPIGTEAIAKYVNESWYKPDSMWFGAIEAHRAPIQGFHMVATSHVVIYGKTAEIGCTVDAEHRRIGFGTDLFVRSATWAKSQGVDVLYMQCLSENQAIQKIARNQGMSIGTIERNEKEATIKVTNSFMDKFNDMMLDNIALYDIAFRSTGLNHFLTLPKN
jgi:RimJ/RimL family protein N-acetyltransferase